MRSTTSSIRRAAAAAAALAALVAAAPASADSIAYVKGGDVWLATPDGKRQQQVTRTGVYSYVSQADNGTMIALTGERLHKLSRTGRVLADFTTYVSDGAPKSGPLNQFHGPFSPEISPDGKLVAFEWYNNQYDGGSDPNCNVTTDCYVRSSRQGVGITRSDRLTGPDEYGLFTGWLYPQWLSNTKLLRSDAKTAFAEDAVFNDIGPGKGDKAMKRWLYDPLGAGLEDVELTRDRRAAVAIAGSANHLIYVYRTLQDPYTAPPPDTSPWGENPRVVEACSQYEKPVGGTFKGLSVAPDGKHFAYEVGNGIWVTDIPDFSKGCRLATENRLVIPGGQHPDWGPADVPPASRYRQLHVTGLLTDVPRALKRGFAFRVAAPAAGRVRITLRVGRTIVGGGAKRVGRKGAGTVVARFTRAAKRKFRSRRSLDVKIRADWTPTRRGKRLKAAGTLRLG